MHIYEAFQILSGISPVVMLVGVIVAIVCYTLGQKRDWLNYVGTSFLIIVVVASILYLISLPGSWLSQKSFAMENAKVALSNEYGINDTFVDMGDPVCLVQRIFTCETYEAQYHISGSNAKGLIRFGTYNTVVDPY